MWLSFEHYVCNSSLNTVDPVFVSRCGATGTWTITSILLSTDYPSVCSYSPPPPYPPSPPPPSGSLLYTVGLQLLTANPNNPALSTWSLSTDPCTWTGITCDASSAITDIALSNHSLVGSLPSNLSLITTLKTVQFLSCSFNGTLPTSWSTLTQLTALNLPSNKLVGTLPAAWSRLSLLSQLNLASNALTGTIPTSWAQAGGMTSLVHLFAQSNSAMCGPLPGTWTTSKVSTTGTLLGSLCAQTSGLLSLVSSVTPASWPVYMSGWTNATDPCSSWTGVTCTGPVVTSLNLAYFSLVGSLPSNLYLVSGLRSLSLTSNR